MYTDESEVDYGSDISDNDPTFDVNNHDPKKRNYIFYHSSSSDSSTAEMVVKKGRKRSKCPAKWKQNKIRRLRNEGKSYLSHSNKKVPARCLQPPCSDKCRLKCSAIINTEERYKIFQQFWDLGDLIMQRAFIQQSMDDIEPKYKYTNAANPRRNNKRYHFVVDNQKIIVCKAFYKATLNISDRMIFTVQNKINESGFQLSDMRGKHNSHKKIDPALRLAIKKHIDSIPRIESHYLREQTTREYICGDKNITDLYKDFADDQKGLDKDAGKYMNYYLFFTTEYNIGFYVPKKDQCDLCTSFANSNADGKKGLEEQYNTHLKEKTYSRDDKKNDRIRIEKNLRVAVYDLQAVMQCPRGNSSGFYYKSKLNCFNLTVTELKKKDSKVAYENVHCYVWTESDAKRGALEIGSCIWEYLKSLCEEDDEEKEVIFYSDNCCGQNKNKYITSLYMFAVQTLNIKSITHKFLIKGHTQNEADSVHSLIQRQIQDNLKSGPIYTPDQYVAIIKTAKKSAPPLHVHELTYESFYDIKKLQEEWGYNFSINTSGQNVNWNSIKMLKMTKEDPTTFFYKSSFYDEAFMQVNVRNKRKKMNPTTEITLKTAYVEKQEVSEKKKKDFRELISSSLIPSFYKSFYDSII